MAFVLEISLDELVYGQTDQKARTNLVDNELLRLFNKTQSLSRRSKENGHGFIVCFFIKSKYNPTTYLIIVMAINIKLHNGTEEQLKAIKGVLKALKIDFEIKKEKEQAYNPEFVEKIKRSEEQYKNGQYRVVTLQELDQKWK